MVRYASHLAHDVDAETAVNRAADQVETALEGTEPTLVVVFASDGFRDEADAVRRAVIRRFPNAEVAGAVIPGGVIGVGEETEQEAAISLWAGVLPPDQIAVMELVDADDLPADDGVVIILTDPFTTQTDRFLHTADVRGIQLVGGFTGGSAPGSARLITAERILTEGAIGIRIDVPGVATVVSQGARPIGSDLVVTAAERNVVLELASKPAVEQLHAVLGALDPEDLHLARVGLMAGIVIDENRPDYDVGDFLVRGLLGIEAGSGGIAIAAEPRVGQTFRVHVRDGMGADADLRRVIGLANPGVGAALMFACTGRGRRMFDTPHHDARVVEELLDVPLAGGFCQGEIGPIAGTNHVHAFTATMVTFPG
jgi:small ligand-binding sensory domain FIST